MSDFGERFTIRVLAWAMNRWTDHAEIRRIFDLRYKNEPEQWRRDTRDTWAAACERAQGKVSR